MNLGKYIHALLLENETVIIPGFGAFISNYKSAEINTETNELKPPSKEINFNQKIRNNDGLLVGSVALGEGVSHFDALKLIEKERENIIYQLDKGEKVNLEETGELYTNEKHEILMIPFEDENLLLESFGLENVSLKASVEETVKEEKEIEAIIPEPEKNKEEVKVEAVQEEEKKKPEPKSIATVIQETPKEEESKTRGWIWMLALIPIIFVGIYFVYQNSVSENPPPQTIDKTKTETAIIDEPAVVIDTLIADSTSVLSEENLVVEDTIPTSAETTEVETPKFYLVGGSFKAEENANNYLLELKEKGFEPFHLGKRGNFYIVGIGAYQTEKEAVIAKRQFYEENPKSGVWIMEAE